MMNLYTLSFYIIAAFILICGALAVTARKLFRAAIWLLFSLAGIGAFYFWLDMQFLAAVQVIVYVGGIVVLIIFSIFHTQEGGADLPKALKNRKLIAASFCLIGFSLLTYILNSAFFLQSSLLQDSSLQAIGRKMLSTSEGGFALPFEVISLLLLAAMIGCIVIAIKPAKE